VSTTGAPGAARDQRLSQHDGATQSQTAAAAAASASEDTSEDSADQSPAPAGFATDARLLRSALHRQVKGVAVITVGADPPVGFCATSLAPVAFDPPTLSFAVSQRSKSWPAVEAADRVMVHLLADDQQDLAHRFGHPGAPRFGPQTRWSRGAHDLPVLDDAMAWLLLKLVARVRLGANALVVGEVTAVRGAEGKAPLLHHSGRFGQLRAERSHFGYPEPD
jgi:flavin reductase (DIM6/NTAB) family NADH-FMN oxidoreductase RutF